MTEYLRLTCPKCRCQLAFRNEAHGIHWCCETCGGRAVGLGVLRKTLGEDFLHETWEGARHRAPLGSRACPICQRAMHELKTLTTTHPVLLHLCQTCYFMWFDARAYESLRPFSKIALAVEPEIVFACHSCSAELRIQASNTRRKYRCPQCQEIYQTVVDESGVLRFHHLRSTRNPSKQNWWEVLEIAPDASLEQVREIYKQRIKEYHPDRVANLGIELRVLAEEKSKQINQAYEEALMSVRSRS